jgi:glycosyltransferase involved in cell wall biosynthesis
MRIVILSDPDLPDPDGNCSPAHRLSVELRRRGCGVLHATPRETGKPSHETLDGVPVRRLPASAPTGGAISRARFAVEGRWAVHRWLPELRKEPPDLLHAHLSFPAVWIASRAAQALGVPWVVHALGGPADRLLSSARGMQDLGGVIRTAAAASASSERGLRALEPWIRPGAARAVIPPGVDPVDAAPPPTDPVILGIGRMERRRGFAVLLRAFAIVHRHRPEASLVLAGDGPKRHRLVDLAESLGDEVRRAIRWEGMPDPARARSLYRSALVVAFPSSRGGSELAVAGAMAGGRAVVVTGSSGPDHAIDGGNVLVVPPGDSSALAEALRRLIEDRPFAERIAHAGRGSVLRNSTWSASAEAHLELLRSAAHVTALEA